MTAYAVARRTQEIGVRMAFGASARDVVREMVRDAACPWRLALLSDWPAPGSHARDLHVSLDTTPTDVPAFATAAALLAFAALVAVWIPARRAALVDPVTSLRSE
jgi:ABC-type antimicrobial peptide transport system permease subunit